MTGRKTGTGRARGLRHGPLGPRTAHLSIDMQRLFARDGLWPVDWMDRVLPVVSGLAERHPERTIFTRFIPPARPEEMWGTWRHYYKRWRQATRDHLDPALLELMAPLAALAPPATVIDKSVYSPFSNPRLLRLLRQRGIDSLVISGLETDICVLSAILDAVDLGFRVILPTDALCSSSDATHDAMLELFHRRFSEQVEPCESRRILAEWR